MNLLRFLKNNKKARKIFGKRELRIIEKQLLGVNLTQSEKNRLSRDIRKKFEFIKQTAKFQDEFKLKKGKIIDQIINQAIKSILQETKDVKKIHLFGSAADKTLHLNSDIDLAVEFDNISLKKATLFKKRILGQVDKKVDILVFEYLPEKIKQEIKTKGKLIYLNENKR